MSHMDYLRGNRITEGFLVKSLKEKNGIPSWPLMSREEVREHIGPQQVFKRAAALGIASETLRNPEASLKLLYYRVMKEIRNLCADVPGQSYSFVLPEEWAGGKEERPFFDFHGRNSSELNRFMAEHPGARIEIRVPFLAMDEMIRVPSGIILHGNGVHLVRNWDAPELDKAILLDRVEDVCVSGITVEPVFTYGLYVKESSRILLEGNRICEVRFKGLVLVGKNRFFCIRRNVLERNNDGGIFIDGDAGTGLIEENRILDTNGMGNFCAGIVLGSAELPDLDSAYYPPKDDYLYNIQGSPHDILLAGNEVVGGRSSGIYSHGGYRNYYVGNTLRCNEKEGICLDNGSLCNYVARNIIRENGRRNRMTNADLKRDFIDVIERLADGSSPLKLPGLSMDNTAYNIICGNLISGNYGSGIKAVRTAGRNRIIQNTIADNNRGKSERYHFYGIEMSSDLKPDEQVKGLDFLPCHENIIMQNTITGAHFAGIFLGKEAMGNYCALNVLTGSTEWGIESLSDKENRFRDNIVDRRNRNIAAFTPLKRALENRKERLLKEKAEKEQ